MDGESENNHQENDITVDDGNITRFSSYHRIAKNEKKLHSPTPLFCSTPSMSSAPSTHAAMDHGDPLQYSRATCSFKIVGLIKCSVH